MPLRWREGGVCGDARVRILGHFGLHGFRTQGGAGVGRICFGRSICVTARWVQRAFVIYGMGIDHYE